LKAPENFRSRRHHRLESRSPVVADVPTPEAGTGFIVFSTFYRGWARLEQIGSLLPLES